MNYPTFSAYLNSDVEPYRYETQSHATDSKGVFEDVIKSTGEGIIECYEWEVSAWNRDYDTAVEVEFMIADYIKGLKEKK